MLFEECHSVERPVTKVISTIYIMTITKKFSAAPGIAAAATANAE